MRDELGRLTLDGLEIAYRTVGEDDAPAVVLLHGWASSRRMWEASQDHLADRFRTVAIDLPGHGASSKPDWTWYSIEHYSDLVLRLGEALGLERPAAVGHSMGGTIALELASRAPQALGRVVVVNPVVTGKVYSRNISLPPDWIRPALRLSRRVWPTASRLLTRPPDAWRRRAPENVLRNTEDLGRTTADSVLGSMTAVLRLDLTERLEQIRSPVLVIVGEQDRVVSPEEGELAAKKIPDARLESLAAAHHPYDEDPEGFLTRLRLFLDEGDDR